MVGRSRGSDIPGVEVTTKPRRGRPPRSPKPATERLELRLTVDENKRLLRAAGDRPLGEWVREVALACAN